MIRVSAAILVAAAATTPLRAQGVPGADTLSRRAVAESLKVLDRLKFETRAHPKDAAVWHHVGMIAFALGERTWSRDTIPGLNYRNLRLLGADALELAANLAPKSYDYLADLRAFHLADHTPLGHSAGKPATCNADLGDYAKEADVGKRVTMLLNEGWNCWLDYDGYANRANPSGAPMNCSTAATAAAPPGMSANDLSIAVLMRGAYERVIETLLPMDFEVAGELDYLRATNLWQEAYRLAPDSARAYRYLALLLATRDSWTELAVLGRDRTMRAPDDKWGWMVFALARYRMKCGRNAQAAFDSAFARLDPADRTPLDRLDRILRPQEQAAWVRLDSVKRAAITRGSWLLADPLWSAASADPRTEFLARVTYAELRWSVPEQQARGVETARGQVYVRYGPPTSILGWVPDDGIAMHTFWTYKSARLVFCFDKNLHMGLAHYNDRGIAEEVAAWQPARWDNIAEATIDSMPTQAARFRAGPDSVDLYLAARAPLESMRQVGVSNVPVTARFWLYSRSTPATFRDSVKMGSSPMLAWTKRVAPGPWYYRVESTMPEALFAGRTAATIVAGPDSLTGFATRGFGMSDIVLASTAPSSATPRRWSDVTFTPLLGDLTRGGQLALIWETYEAGQNAGSATYDIVIGIQRQQTRSAGGRIAAQVVGRLASGVGITTGKDNVEMRIARNVSYAPVLTDNVGISLGDTPPGIYLLTVQVIDRVSGRMTSRSSNITIREEPKKR